MTAGNEENAISGQTAAYIAPQLYTANGLPLPVAHRQPTPSNGKRQAAEKALFTKN